MDLLFLVHLLNALLMIGLPFIIGLWLTRRFKLGWRIFWIGAATFIISQVGHIPFNSGVNLLFTRGVIPIPSRPVLVYIINPIFGGLSAGLFEELTRAAVYKWWAKDARSWRKGVLMGAGHEGAEAIAFGLIALVAFFQMAALRNADLSKIVPANQLPLLTQQVTSYWSLPALTSLLGAVERLLTFPIQISLSVLVLQAFTRDQPAWVPLAILWHALVDGVVVYLSALWAGQAWMPLALEGVVLVFALLSLGIIFALRRPEPGPEAPSAPPPSPLPEISPAAEEPKPEALDDSRYILSGSPTLG